MATEEKNHKQHDLEETPRETARRLIPKWTKARAEEEQRYRQRLARHARHLSAQDQTELLEHIEGQHQLLVERIRDHSDDLPEFGFSSELLDDEDYDGNE
jgi:hypothetical protein